jgi:hypothetical protein
MIDVRVKAITKTKGEGPFALRAYTRLREEPFRAIRTRDRLILAPAYRCLLSSVQLLSERRLAKSRCDRLLFHDAY